MLMATRLSERLITSDLQGLLFVGIKCLKLFNHKQKLSVIKSRRSAINMLRSEYANIQGTLATIFLPALGHPAVCVQDLGYRNTPV